MDRLTFEEKGLLRILEGIQSGGLAPEPTVRIALLRRGLLEPGEPASLSQSGLQAVHQLRQRNTHSALTAIVARNRRVSEAR